VEEKNGRGGHGRILEPSGIVPGRWWPSGVVTPRAGIESRWASLYFEASGPRECPGLAGGLLYWKDREGRAEGRSEEGWACWFLFFLFCFGFSNLF